ncbi:hypothetical protein ACF09G_31550 [Streptomyces albogriseolus]|uniref:hypothetical protein n=1 Tax=Streptomyces albogriseolus TaxID=1887 RepID=UPI00198DA7A7|nr:hypothetical protein [Streptomyces sp.]
MPVFFLYSHDGGPQDAAALEFAPNLDIPRRQLVQRTADGTGIASFVAALPKGQSRVTWRDYQAVKSQDEWPPATDKACVWMWWRYADRGIPDPVTEAADEVWRLSAAGAVEREQRPAVAQTTAPVRHGSGPKSGTGEAGSR